MRGLRRIGHGGGGIYWSRSDGVGGKIIAGGATNGSRGEGLRWQSRNRGKGPMKDGGEGEQRGWDEVMETAS
jgi:hypothetical protein